MPARWDENRYFSGSIVEERGVKADGQGFVPYHGSREPNLALWDVPNMQWAPWSVSERGLSSEVKVEVQASRGDLLTVQSLSLLSKWYMIPSW